LRKVELDSISSDDYCTKNRAMWITISQ